MSLKNRNFNHHQRYTHHIYHNETVIVRTIFSNHTDNFQERLQ